MGHSIEKDSSSAVGQSYQELYAIIKRLRSDDGCPWDREQTVQSLASDLLEEVYECIDAFSDDDTNNALEELGDLHLMAVFISIVYEESGTFALFQVLDAINKKLIRRHPHVFGGEVAETSAEVIRRWEEIKQQEKKNKKYRSFLDSVPKSFPPLERAYRLQKACAGKGLDWHDANEVHVKLHEEMDELEEAIELPSEDAEKQERIEEELGDLLFTVINLSRHLGTDPGIALHRSTVKFEKRVRYVEKCMSENGHEMCRSNMPIMDQLWEEYKSKEK